MIAGAARPVIYAGGGGVIASGGDAELMQLAETLMIPVTTTLMGGLGAIPSRHPPEPGNAGGDAWNRERQLCHHRM